MERRYRLNEGSSLLSNKNFWDISESEDNHGEPEDKDKYEEFIDKLNERLSGPLSNFVRERKTRLYIKDFLRKTEQEVDLEKFEEDLLFIAEQTIEYARDTKGACDLVKEVFTHDPRVLLGIPPKEPALKRLDREQLRKLDKILEEHLGKSRGRLARLVLYYAITATSSRYGQIPILLGPPAAGKSYLPWVLAQALQELGLKVEIVAVNAGADRDPRNDELEMKLLGIDIHWGNASPGEIYRLSRNAEFVIVVLDEIDKRKDRRLFLEMFDFGVPLQDRCISHIAPKMNLRPKVLFIGTANEYSWKGESALDSRVVVLEFPPYSLKEKLEIIDNIAEKHILKEYPPRIRDFIIKKLRELVINAGVDIRKALGIASSLGSIVELSASKGLSEREILEEIELMLSQLHLGCYKQPFKLRIGF